MTSGEEPEWSCLREAVAHPAVYSWSWGENQIKFHFLIFQSSLKHQKMIISRVHSTSDSRSSPPSPVTLQPSSSYHRQGNASWNELSPSSSSKTIPLPIRDIITGWSLKGQSRVGEKVSIMTGSHLSLGREKSSSLLFSFHPLYPGGTSEEKKKRGEWKRRERREGMNTSLSSYSPFTSLLQASHNNLGDASPRPIHTATVPHLWLRMITN